MRYFNNFVESNWKRKVECLCITGRTIKIRSYKGNRNLNYGKSWGGGTVFFRLGYDWGHPQEHFKLFCEVLSGGEQYGITRFLKFCHYVGILYRKYRKMAKNHCFVHFLPIVWCI